MSTLLRAGMVGTSQPRLAPAQRRHAEEESKHSHGSTPEHYRNPESAIKEALGDGEEGEKEEQESEEAEET